MKKKSLLLSWSNQISSLRLTLVIELARTALACLPCIHRNYSLFHSSKVKHVSPTPTCCVLPMWGWAWDSKNMQTPISVHYHIICLVPLLQALYSHHLWILQPSTATAQLLVHSTLCDRTDCGSPGFSVTRGFQVKTWSELPFLLQGIVLNMGISVCLSSPALAGALFTAVPPGKPKQGYYW